MTDANAPIIVSALLGPDDFAALNRIRRQHYPRERNVIDAHLTLFHHLPPSIAPELRHRLTMETRNVPRPAARLSGIMSLGRGVAFRVESPDLEAVRARLADAFESLLIPQDQQHWRPHVTIQNKVTPSDAKALLHSLSQDFEPRSIEIVGLASWYYRGGPWEALSTHKFAR